MIFFLVKIFEEKKYADDLMRGKMFANRLSNFKKIEDGEGRGDAFEGAVMPQLDGLTIELSTTNESSGEVENITIREEEFAAPPIIRPKWFDNVNVFCMVASHSGGFQYVSVENIRDYQKQVKMPEECIRFGRHAVLVKNYSELLRRVKVAAELQGYDIWWRLVEYYDPEVGTPPAGSNLETIFSKRNKYEHQREFRIAIDTRNAGSGPIILDIGEIDDIAFCVNTSDIIQNLTVQVPGFS